MYRKGTNESGRGSLERWLSDSESGSGSGEGNGLQ